MTRTADDVRQAASPLADDMGLELVDVECKGPDKRRFVRVLIHRDGGVSAADCRSLARALQAHFDDHNFFFPGIYQLEVASPGLDRPLRSARDFTRNLGQRIRLFLNEPCDGKLEWVGRVVEVVGDSLRLDVEAHATKRGGGKKGKGRKGKGKIRPSANGNGAGPAERRDFPLERVSRGKLLLEF